MFCSRYTRSSLQRPNSQRERGAFETWLDEEFNELARSPADCLVSAPESLLSAIENVRLGSRVDTRNPLGSSFENVARLETEDLAEIHITIERANGSIVDAELLRPLSDLLNMRIGDSVPIYSEELEVDGTGIVESIRVFEGRSRGEGNLITGRFKTREVQDILRVTLSDGEVIEGTKSHPVWAVNIASFLRLDELVVGDLLDTLAGPQNVVAIDLVVAPQPVYNIEVAGEHVYRIGQSGVLVHNVSDDCPLVQITVSPAKAATLRNSAGTVSGGESLPTITSTSRWFKGTSGSLAEIPGQVAAVLRGKSFKNFDEFREVFWKAVAANADLATHFGTANLTRMQKGLAPIAPASQHHGKIISYTLHHRNPIHNGGEVYSLDNLLIVSPKYHQSILDPAFHLGN